jgi:hypothetical protein
MIRILEESQTFSLCIFFNVESEYAAGFALSIIVFALDYGKIVFFNLYII